MRNGIVVAVLLTICVLPAGAQQPITVEDVVRFGTIDSALFSPDGARAAVVVRRGNPERETNDAVLLVYRTADLLREPRADTIAAFASASNYPPLAGVRWLDNETLIFAGTRGRDPSQVYRVDVRTRRTEPLTRLETQLISYEVSASGERLVTLTEQPPRPPAQDPICQRRGCLVKGAVLVEAERGLPYGATTLIAHDVHTGQARALEHPRAIDPRISWCDDVLAGGLSADGRFALHLCRLDPREFPAWWGEYTADPALRDHFEKKNQHYFWRAVIVDLVTGENFFWTDAPTLNRFNRRRALPIWIDGSRVILPEVVESLTNVDAEEHARRVSSFSAMLLDARTRESTRIARLEPGARVVGASWDAGYETLTIEVVDSTGASLPAQGYRRTGGRWVRAEPKPSQVDSRTVDLVIEQSLNDPPVLVAVNRLSGKRRQVLDPNPWLAGRTLGHVEAFTWEAPNGRTWNAGLYYPPDYTPGRRYPLMIQTHGFDPNQFSMTGYARVHAGRALAAHDILVLQVHERYPHEYGRLDEWPTVQRGWESVIDLLDRRGLIDRDRIAIQGWSRTGAQMMYALAHSSYPFRAAVLTNSGALGWWSYLSWGAPPAYDLSYGAAPFGEGLYAWLEHSPTFNLDGIRTPVFLWGEKMSGVSGVWDIYAGLRRLKTPVEYWFAPEGTHNIFQAGQRMQLYQLIVDWVRFWLKDEEDPDPAKEEQYTRWRRLRAEWPLASTASQVR